MSGAADAGGERGSDSREGEDSESGRGGESGSDRAAGAVSRGPAERGSATTDAPLCDLCGSPMRETHCKLVCDRCGYIRDCSDP